MGWIGCARCENFWRNIVAQTFALNAPIQPILHRVSCSHEMVPNAPKYYETQQTMSLGSNGVDRVRLLQKFWCNFLAQTFALIVPVWPILHRVSCSKKMIPNAPKQYEMHQNMILGSNAVDRVHLLRIILIWLQGMYFYTNYTSSSRFAPSYTVVIKQSQMHLNTMKHAKTCV